ncbi:MAG: HD domain-containing protein [Verrucomicrobia bacterium]|nr:HD domain-containing protein [Verrucomicrobiota bacterium]
MSDYDPFIDRHKFQDDVWGQIHLNDLERDVIDTPEFQRLFRTSQLGFVHLVYSTANHTRGTHSIGACYNANRLIENLYNNTARLRAGEKDENYATFGISPSEKILIRLGALLHDISHGPLSHDIEKKTHKVIYDIPGVDLKDRGFKVQSYYGQYYKHDDYERHPLLYMLTCNGDVSVLAQVLIRYSVVFWNRLKADGAKPEYSHIKDFTIEMKKFLRSLETNERKRMVRELLPRLLFHLLFYETKEEGKEHERNIATGFDSAGNPKLEKWSLVSGEWGHVLHHLWYQPFRHDIIGNTLSADLLDYLKRDPHRMGTRRRIDLHLLNYYVLVPPSEGPSTKPLKTPDGEVLRRPSHHRCAIDLRDSKRGTTRIFLINDIFRLLDLRQEIHEKAVMHRVVQSAVAMLARALLLLERCGLKPGLKDIVGIGSETHALQGDDRFFRILVERASTQEEDAAKKMQLGEARRLVLKLSERRVFRPLMIVSNERAGEVLEFQGRTVSPQQTNKEDSEFLLRILGALVDSTYYSPFLLFVSACVEKYLDGVFDDDLAVCNHVDQILRHGEGSILIAEAMKIVPSRVIIWTTPYKQLYKDPALVVAMHEHTGRIDEVGVDTPGMHKQKAALTRIESSIKDADSKYQGLWQLYVFISDGLFYTGLLQKLKQHFSKHNTSRQHHQIRLRYAEELIKYAFKVMMIDWAATSKQMEHEGMGPVEEGKKLGVPMDENLFKTLLPLWISIYRHQRPSDPTGPHEFSTVDTAHYSHEGPLKHVVHHPDGRNCRDTRYKFDRDASSAWTLALKDSRSIGYKLIEHLNSIGNISGSDLSDREFADLVSLYDSANKEKGVEDALSQEVLGHRMEVADLKLLWRAGFPWPSEEQTPTRPQAVITIPESREQIMPWFEKEMDGLPLHFTREIRQSANEITDQISPVPRERWSSIFQDFHNRFQQHRTFIWNNVRRKEVLSVVSEKCSVGGNPPPPPDDDGDPGEEQS